MSARARRFSRIFGLGENFLDLENSTIQPYARIANNMTLWSGSAVRAHHATIEDNVFVSGNVIIAGGVTVGEGCFLGVSSTIRDLVKLGRRCVIGAGALILRDTEDGSVYTSPAARKSPVPKPPPAPDLIADVGKQEIDDAVFRRRTSPRPRAAHGPQRRHPGLWLQPHASSAARTFEQGSAQLAATTRSSTWTTRPRRILDNTEELAEGDPHVIACQLSRNFGQQIAITAGLEQCRGDYVVVMDCDLQDPPGID